jgi:LmbE family N-acetylglucosaminyl deacetylase
MPHALFLSPHLDDVAFSCGGALARWLRAGWDATVATVFTASVAEPSDFAIACRRDKGLPADCDYMALRRAEDDAFAEALRDGRSGTLALRHGPFAEAPHRGYASADALFAGVRDADDVWRRIRAWLREHLDATTPALIVAPQALGRHADHLHVARAVRSLADKAKYGPPVAWYRDVPYALRTPEASPCRWVPRNDRAERCAVPLPASALDAKLRGAAAYASQIGFQFGGEAKMRDALTGFARAEGRRNGCRLAVEEMRLARA